MPFLRTCFLHEVERAPELQLRTIPGRQIESATVRDAVAEVERLLKIRLVPCDKPIKCCFEVEGLPDGDKRLVGISIYRGGAHHYPEDITFPLQDSDCVGVGVLAG